MKLQATITEIISGSEYPDNRQRIKLKVEGADSMFRSLIVPNDEGYPVDQELVLLVLTKEQAAALSGNLDLVVSHGYAEFTALADQLRPDPPVPFLVDDPEFQQPDSSVVRLDADTQEFAREVGR